MPTYQVPCACGGSVGVELFQAGSDVVCPACRQMMTVPSSLTLQELAKERHPHLSAIEKVRMALAERDVPFDGTCQRCGDRPAAFARTVTFNYLTERVITGEEGLQASPLGMKLVVGAAEEHWETVKFPLLHCEICNDQFQRDWTRSWWVQSGVSLLLAFIAGPLIIVGVLLLLTLPLIGGGIVVLAVVMFAQFLGRKKTSSYIQNVLASLPLVSTAIKQEDEYRITVGNPKPL